jgi:hypothetical protein
MAHLGNHAEGLFVDKHVVNTFVDKLECGWIERKKVFPRGKVCEG